jgi:hypothetical protein
MRLPPEEIAGDEHQFLGERKRRNQAMTKTAADFPVGSKVWVIDGVIREGTVRDETPEGIMFNCPLVEFVDRNMFYPMPLNCFATELEALTELCARLDAEAERKRIAWSDAYKAAGEMRKRLEVLSETQKQAKRP